MQGSNSCLTAPKPKERSIWLPRAESTRTSAAEEPCLADAGRSLHEHAAGPPPSELRHRPAQHRRLPRPIDEVGPRPVPRCRLIGRQCHLHLRGRSVERRRLRKHLGLEGAERGPRVDAQLFCERLPGPTQRRQRARLPLGAVEREREEPPPLLPERVLGHECLELADDESGVPQLQSRLQQALAADRPQLVEPQGLGLHPRLADILGIRRSAPQPQRVVQRVHRVRGGETRRGVHGSLEAPRVHAVGAEPEHVAGPLPGDDALAPACPDLRLQAPPKVAHVGLQGARRVGGRAVTPDAVGEAIGGDDLVAHDDQGRKYGALAPPAEVYGRAVPRGRELAEHPQAQLRIVVHPLPRVSSVEDRTMAEWAGVFDGTDACVAPVLSITEAARDPHMVARGSLVEHGGIVQPAPAPRFSRTGATLGTPPTGPGADTVDALEAWGVKDVGALVESGAAVQG